MSYSLNEIQVLAYKASRGVGLSWGMAEEAAQITQKLCSYGVDALSILIRVLRHLEEFSETDIRPVMDGNHWRAKETMSPLYAGVNLLDRACILDARTIELSNVKTPIFLSPVIATLAKIWDTPIVMQGAGIEVFSAPDNVIIDGNDMDSGNISIKKVDIETETIANTRKNTAITLATRAQVEACDYQLLNEWAQRIYAPENELSRLKGAGAGVNDND